MTDTQQRAAAKAFAKNWKDRGYEKGDSQIFWVELLTTVFGVTEISQFISFEDQVHLDHTSFIDGYIEKTHVMIEQKSINKSLTAAIRQSDGSMLTPFEQAKRYSSELPYSKRPRWIVTSNFQSFYIYDMEKPGGDPEIIQLENLEKEYYRLQFLVDEGNTNLQREMEVSILDGIKASISAETKETATSSSKVVESLDVKTTKSILLRRVIEQCASVNKFDNSVEGDLVKVDHVKLELLDEDSLRQFLILRRDALKGMRVEGMEINNLIGSMLQDYAYILKGIVYDESMETAISEIIIKIPMEIQSEFENKYNINDLLIGHVSIVGIYKGIVKEEFITSNTFTYFQEVDTRKGKQAETAGKIIKSNTPSVSNNKHPNKSNKNYHFVDTLAIIQDVAFKLEEVPALKLHWWNKFGIWLSTLWRK